MKLIDRSPSPYRRPGTAGAPLRARKARHPAGAGAQTGCAAIDLPAD